MNPLDELCQCATGHPIFFDALRHWLGRGNHIHIIPGNHDFQLAFPDVQDVLQNLIFPGPFKQSDVPLSPNLPISFSYFYHDPPLRLYVEHGDRYCIPQRPGQPPATYRRDYYFTSALKSRLPVATVYRSHYVSSVLAADPLALLPAFRNLRGFLFDPPFEMPARASSENVTLHTINVNIIQTNWKRAQGHARTMQTLITASILLRLVAAILPGAAAAAFLTLNNLLGAFGLLAAAAIARAFAAAAARQGQDIAQLDLPRAAAEDIARAVERAGVQTLIFGHSHIPDRARFGRLTYINTGAWTNVIAPYSAIEPATRTYAHVDDDACPEHGRRGHARLLQWTDRGPVEPIIFGK
jgi:UDP-2,3-diacylglucosamine pyrophosphatase LpxH